MSWAAVLSTASWIAGCLGCIFLAGWDIGFALGMIAGWVAKILHDVIGYTLERRAVMPGPQHPSRQQPEQFSTVYQHQPAVPAILVKPGACR